MDTERSSGDDLRMPRRVSLAVPSHALLAAASSDALYVDVDWEG